MIQDQQTHESLQCTFAARMELAAKVIQRCLCLLRQQGYHTLEVPATLLRELLSNAVIHGSGEDPAKHCLALCGISQDLFSLLTMMGFYRFYTLETCKEMVS